MKTPLYKNSVVVKMIKQVMRIGVTLSAGALITLFAVAVIFLNSKPDLNVWHRAELDEEFTVGSPVKTFADYLALEERLFQQLDEKVHAHIRPEERNPINRFNSGSLSDPASWPANWNRTYGLLNPEPVAGALLLHGMSDSPYSLRHLGERLFASGMRVLGLRIPGHGTAPSGLVHVQWEDMAAAVKLAMRHLREKLGDRPLYIVGYSNGGALAMHYVLSALGDASLPGVKGVVLISPEIGVTELAALAVWQARIGRWLGLPKLAWESVLPEYDPFKYNSFAVNAGNQAYRLTTEIQNQIGEYQLSGKLSLLPPIMAFQSVVDATVSTPALIEGLFDRLPKGGHELVMFDINRFMADGALIKTGPREKIAALLDKPMRAYRLTLISNESVHSRKVAVFKSAPESNGKTVLSLDLSWPVDVYSLSHVALPFAPDDPLYGGNTAGKSPGVQLGDVVLRGEKGVLRINPAGLLRMHWNPFYDYMEQRVLEFMKLASKAR